MIKQQEKLSPLQVEKLLKTLAQRFQQHTERHAQMSWDFVQKQLLLCPEKLWAYIYLS